MSSTIRHGRYRRIKHLYDMVAPNESSTIMRVHEEGVLAADDGITSMAVQYAHEDSLSTENQSQIDFDDVTSMAPITHALGSLSFEQQDDDNNLDDDAFTRLG